MKMNYECEFEGFEEKLGKNVYVFPALNFNSLKVLGLKIASLMEVDFEERVDIILQVIHASLVMNYPEITYEEVVRLVPVNKGYTIYGKIMEVSGLVPEENKEKSKENGEEAKN